MSRKILTGLALVATLAFGSTLALAADPTLTQVYQAAQSGHLSDAQAMMTQVLRDHPGSAKAHFVEAELLAKQGRMPEARSELGTAQQLAPGLPFAKPAAVQELQGMLTARGGMAQPALRQPSFPWGLMLMGVLLAITLAFFIRSLRRPQVVVQPAPGNMPYGSGYPGGGYGSAPVGGGYGPMPMGGGGGIGSGILGGLATGAAVGAGMVAGEALMERVLGGGHASTLGGAPVIMQDDNLLNTQQYDLGGNDFGVTDTGSWDDNSGGGFGVGGGDDWT